MRDHKMMNLNENLPDPILITGAARSGTSMVAGSVHLCGAFGGNMSGPNKNNMKGMFENARIRNNITKPYLRKLGVDALGQFPLPRIEDMPIPANWRSMVEQVIKEEGYPGGPWFYKGAKMALTWPLWHYAFPNAKWIIVRRKTSDIINSCLRTDFMRAFSMPNIRRQIGAKDEREGWLWWVHEHEKRFVQMIETGLNVKIVWPERMVKGDYRQLMEAIEWLGLQWSSEVLGFIEPKLWKARRATAPHGLTPSPRNK